jgi:uridine kinase
LALSDALLVQADKPSARILIDGRSGSGKSSLADELVAALPQLQLVRLEDMYPGWDGLAAASRMAHDEILAADRPRWQRWDWVRAEPAQWHELDHARGILIEGCGALSRANRALATFGVWVECDAATRKRRALARDGDTYAPYWDRWADQEDEFIAAENPVALADLIVHG